MLKLRPLGRSGHISGGTYFCGTFIGGHCELPQVPGEMQCRMLGAAVEAWSVAGQPVVDEVGALVCTQPLPSMPLYLWGDPAAAEARGGDPLGSRYLSN